MPIIEKLYKIDSILKRTSMDIFLLGVSNSQLYTKEEIKTQLVRIGNTIDHVRKMIVDG